MSKSSKYQHFSILGALVAVGMAASAFILGNQFKHIQQPSGTISVQGLAEVEHKATLGTWRVGATTVAASYSDATEKNKTEIVELTKFLVTQGLKPESFELKPIYVAENVESYIDDLGKDRSRKNGFKASRDLFITTNDLETLKKTFANIQDLKAKNMAISFDSPHYYLENVEELKRSLIAKATQDAYSRAEEFAKNGSVKVGNLQSAEQESFNISTAQPSNDSSNDKDGYDTSSINKKVRLVVKAQYAIN